MGVVMGVSIGTEEVRVVRATSTTSRRRVPDLVFERGALTVGEALRVIRMLAGQSGEQAGR